MKGMTYIFSLPHKDYKFRYDPIGTAPLAARFQLLMVYVSTLLTVKRYGDVLSVSKRVARLIKAYVKVSTHNAHLRRKADMLLNPDWRARVLKDLGGSEALIRWDKSVTRARLRREGYLAPIKRRKAEGPIGFNTPEHIAESERLKAHKRACAKACASAREFRDPFKMDQDGLFRLAPLPRLGTGQSADTRAPRIYTQQTIEDYHYNAVPLYKPKGFGPAPVWPIEFYAAMGMSLTLERPNYAAIDLSEEPMLQIDQTCQIEDITKEDELFSAARPMYSPAPIFPEPISPTPLIAFIGKTTYNYIFETPI